MPAKKYAFLLLFLPFAQLNANIITFKGQNQRLPIQEVIEIFRAAQHTIDSLEIAFQNKFNSTILQTDQGIYLHLKGLNHIFEFQNNRFVSLYKKNFHGFNFSSYTFLYGEKIYNYGGSGFWQNNKNLVYFDEDIGEWEFKYSTQSTIPPNQVGGKYIFKGYDYLYIINDSELAENRKNIEQSELTAYRLSLNEWSIEIIGKINNDIQEEMKKEWLQIECLDYVFNFEISGLSFRIINKNTLKFKNILKDEQHYIKTKTDQTALKNNLAKIYTYGNHIEIYNREFFPIMKFNADSLYAIESTSYPLINPKKANPIWVYLLGFGLFGGVFLGLPILKTRLNWSPISNYNLPNFPYGELLKYLGQTINQEVLDECLYLNTLSTNSARNKRSQILKNIKNNFSDIVEVERIQDHVDGRIFLYRILAKKPNEK